MQSKCRDCDFKHSFCFSPQIDSTKDNGNRRMKTMEINVRTVYGFRSIGVVHKLLTKFCSFLNMLPPMTKNTYDGLFCSIKVASKGVAEKSMFDAAARQRGHEPTAEAIVSVDGTW